MTLRETLVQQTEKHINDLRENERVLIQRQDELQNKLEELGGQIEEARSMLQLIKTGKMPVAENGQRTLKRIPREDIIAILPELPQPFGTREMAEALDMNKATGQGWIKRLLDEGVLTDVTEGEVTKNNPRRVIFNG